MQLTKVEKDVLEKIVGFGGYITKEILALYKNDVTSKRCYFILKRLEEKNYIKKIDYFESAREPHVYQVTSKACNEFGRRDAYMRKKHQNALLRRYLLRSHFLFKFISEYGEVTLFSSEDRKRYVNSILKISDTYLPKKYYANGNNVHLEEYILEPKSAKSRTLYLLYADNIELDVYGQLKKLVKKYKRIDVSGQCFLEFIVACENEDRKMAYETEYKKIESPISMINLKAVSIDRNYRSTLFF